MSAVLSAVLSVVSWADLKELQMAASTDSLTAGLKASLWVDQRDATMADKMANWMVDLMDTSSADPMAC